MLRVGQVAGLWLVLLLGVGHAWAEAPPHIQAVQEFLLAWGKGDWDALKARTGGKVTVKVGGAESTLDAGTKKADAQLVLPFRGLSSVREKSKVTGVTVEQITVQVGGQEKQGKATVSLEEKDGGFSITGVTIE
jgi:hypothetical protein